jgi:protein-tyrosine phosphatase
MGIGLGLKVEQWYSFHIMKKLDLSRTLNTRGLEGYVTTSGKIIKPWRFIRSDALTHLTDEEISMLYDRGIATQIDLRTPRVADKYASPLRDDNRFSYHLFPIVEGTNVPLDEEKVPELYMAMLSHHHTFKGILEAMANAEGGVIYNCSAGKDRTGMVTFLLLELAGISRDVIASDYALSSDLIDAKLPEIRKLDPSFPAFLGYSKREYIEKFFVLFDQKYRDIYHYLEIIGVSKAHQEALLNKMLA